MEDIWYKTNINYYCREKYYNHMYKVAKQGSSKFTENIEYPFYRGISLILNGQTQRGIQELTPLQSNRDVHIGVILALIYANKRLKSVDREVLHSLDSKLKEERKQSSSVALYYAALFLSLAEKHEKAAEYISKSLKKDSSNINTIILKGWNGILMSKELPDTVTDCFNLALSKSEKHVEVILGMAKIKSLIKNPDGSNLLLDQLIVNHAGQVVPLIEKMKNDFALKKWEAVLDTMDRITAIEPNNIEVFKTRIFITLCKTGDLIEATDLLDKFFTSLDTEEPMNGYQFYETSKLFSRACGRSKTVLTQAFRFIQHASELYPTNAEYLSEIGNHCLLQDKTKDAQSFFKAASKIDSNSITALCGLTLCQLIDGGSSDQIEQQVELLIEMQGSVQLPILQLLSAKISKKNATEIVALLTDAADSRISEVSKLPYSLKYVWELDPDFLLQLYKELQQHIPKKPFIILGCLLYGEENSNQSVNCCIRILETIINACPGLVVALLELAKLKFLFGFSSEAQKLVQDILKIDNTHAGAYILLAQIYIQQKLYQKASQSLEICLSYSFKVRDSPMYHLINGIIQKNCSKIQEALVSLTTSMQIFNTKKNCKSIECEVNLVDKVTLYLQLIEVRVHLEQYSEAEKLMQDGIQEFSFTQEEGRLMLAKADMALRNGDSDRALDLLSEIKVGQPYYFQARTKMAQIYLKEKNDRAMFTNCFRDLVSNHPNTDSHVIMGDAYMSIGEPHLAVSAYESAAATNPNSVVLINKLVTSLVKTHQFIKATQLYEDSIKNIPDDDLKFAYIELLLKLKQYEKADAYIGSELESARSEGAQAARTRVRYLLAQAQARESRGMDTALLLMEARRLQAVVLRADHAVDVQEEKRRMSSILCALARMKAAREPAVAANLYAEALVNVPREPDTLLALAKLYAQMNNSERCEQTCAILLNTDPNHEAAAVMMADLSFRKLDFDTAQRHLAQILAVKPQSWRALAQLIEVQWRRGRLQEAEDALEAAKEAMGTREDEGYNYCAGIMAAYSGRPNAALRLLNQCRRSAEWGRDAARRMVLLCLSQHSNGPLFESPPDSESGDTRALALRTAEKLLAEVEPRERVALGALLALAERGRSQAERVLHELLPRATDDEHADDPYLILAIANAYTILKQPTRAKNALKRTTSSIPWTPEKADGLERCWLEVAEQQIGAGRGEAARELLNKLVAHNKSCTPAYQHLGFLCEKEQNYKQAALNYEQAWLNSSKGNFTVGYKLAYCYLKLKKYPEAIVICRHILKEQPDYPKIRKEIFEKAKNNLRT